MLLAALAVTAAALVGWPRRGSRLAVIRPAPGPEPARAPAASWATGPARVRFLVAAGGLTTSLLVLGPPRGVPVGVVAAIAATSLRGPPRPRPVSAPRQVPVFADVLAGCLAAGAGTADAVAAAGAVGDAWLRQAATELAAALRDGVPAEQAWQPWTEDPALAAVARTALRTSASGAAWAAELRRIATRSRARQRADAARRVRQASVLVVVPLGLCFLPAFVLVGIVPLVAGLLGGIRSLP